MNSTETLPIPITVELPSRLDRLIAWVLSWVLPFLECEPKRRENNEVYMTRYYLLPRFLHRIIGIGVYIQEFHFPDSDHALHDHPFAWSYGTPLLGGYVEERASHRIMTHYRALGEGYLETHERTIMRGNINSIDRWCYHRIAELIGPRVVTLFIAGPRVQPWGFLVPGRGWVHWRTRLMERGIEVRE